MRCEACTREKVVSWVFARYTVQQHMFCMSFMRPLTRCIHPAFRPPSPCPRAFLQFSTIPSAPDDPLPLAPESEAEYSVLDGLNSQSIAIYIEVQRFWRYQLINT
jgi:hypothetical protein